MKNLKQTAGTMDKICHALSIANTIGIVAMIVGLVILAAAFLFELPPHLIGTGYNQADLGFATITVADAYLPDHRLIWAQAAMEMFLTLLCLTRTHIIFKAIRAIFAPMKEGEPFHNTISDHLNKIARAVFSLGIAWNLKEIISNILLIKAYDLHLLLLSERILHVEFLTVFDLGFLLIYGILLLLSYVFRYGQDLQQLSDETL